MLTGIAELMAAIDAMPADVFAGWLLLGTSAIGAAWLLIRGGDPCANCTEDPHQCRDCPPQEGELTMTYPAAATVAVTDETGTAGANLCDLHLDDFLAELRVGETIGRGHTVVVQVFGADAPDNIPCDECNSEEV